MEVHEPYTYLVGLSIADLEDLQEDIRVYGELERGENRDFWSDVTVIVEDELQKLKKLDRQAREEAGAWRGLEVLLVIELCSMMVDLAQIVIIYASSLVIRC